MNGFQKVEKIKAAPSNDLDLPEGPQIQVQNAFSRFMNSILAAIVWPALSTIADPALLQQMTPFDMLSRTRTSL
jgi:hypothetical protein